MALLSASAATDEGTKPQSTTNSAQRSDEGTRDISAAGGGRWALEHNIKCIPLHYINFDPPKSAASIIINYTCIRGGGAKTI